MDTWYIVRPAAERWWGRSSTEFAFWLFVCDIRSADRMEVHALTRGRSGRFDFRTDAVSGGG